MESHTSDGAPHRALQPLTLSPSAINDFLSCRLRYALGYLTPLMPHERKPVSLLAFGEAIHKAIADFHRLGGWSQLSNEDLVTILGSHWPDGVYADEDIAMANFERATGLLERFYDNPFPDSVTKELGIEQRFTWRRFRRGILATGRIDRACQLADGSVVLIDYKTAAKPRAAETLQREPQALIYRSLGGEAYGHLSPPRVLISFFYLAVGAPVTVEFGKEDFGVGWERIERVAIAIREGIAAVIAGEAVVKAFPPRRGLACQRCPMERHCDGLAAAGAFDGIDSDFADNGSA